MSLSWTYRRMRFDKICHLGTGHHISTILLQYRYAVPYGMVVSVWGGTPYRYGMVWCASYRMVWGSMTNLRIWFIVWSTEKISKQIIFLWTSMECIILQSFSKESIKNIHKCIWCLDATVFIWFRSTNCRVPSGHEKFLVIVDLQGWGYSNCDTRAYIAALNIMQVCFIWSLAI